MRIRDSYKVIRLLQELATINDRLSYSVLPFGVLLKIGGIDVFFHQEDLYPLLEKRRIEVEKELVDLGITVKRV